MRASGIAGRITDDGGDILPYTTGMTTRSAFSTFLSHVTNEAGTVPRLGLIFVGLAGTISGMSDLIYWASASEVLRSGYMMLAVVLLPSLAAAYGTTMVMIERPLSVLGFVKFTIVTALVFLPILCCFALLGLASRTGLPDGMLILAVLALLFIGVAVAGLLPAWPIAQALSSQVVNPAIILRASRGYRWALILAFLVSGSVNKLMPSMTSATGIGTAVVLAAIGAVVSSVALILNASIAVTAWKYAARQDISPAGS